MSEVLRKKIRAAGGLAPRILQCTPLWDALVTGAQDWACHVYAHDLEARITGRYVISGRKAAEEFGERFAFVPLTKTSGPLRAVSIDRPGAARYAAARLHQDAESLMNASGLFLKLLCEQPAQSLWAAMQASFDGGPAAALGDPEAAPEAIDPNSRIAQVSLSLAAGGDEDGWLLEGGEEPPEIRLYFDLGELERHVRKLNEKARTLAAGKDATGQAALRSRLRESSIRLDAVIDQLEMSIAECSRLEAGQVLPLTGAEAGQLSLCAETMNGFAVVGQGEMGNWKGQRALKLNAPVVESFIREIAKI